MVDYEKPLTLSLLAFILLSLGFIATAMATYVFLYQGEFYNYGLLAVLNLKIYRFLAVIIFSVLILFSAIGLLKSSSWGRGLLIILNMVLIVHSIIMVFSGILRGALTLIICIIVTIYMFTQPVSQVFQPIDSRKAVSAINILDSYRKGRYYR